MAPRTFLVVEQEEKLAIVFQNFMQRTRITPNKREIKLPFLEVQASILNPVDSNYLITVTDGKGLNYLGPEPGAGGGIIAIQINE